MANERFTAWLTPSEREGIRDLAKENATSENYIVRLAIRQFLGLPIAAAGGRLNTPKSA